MARVGWDSRCLAVSAAAVFIGKLGLVVVILNLATGTKKRKGEEKRKEREKRRKIKMRRNRTN